MNYDPMKTQEEINMEVHTALYGTEEEPGVVQQVREISEILSAFRLFGKAIMWIALFIGAVGTAVVTLGGWVKHLFNK